ncbi:MAG: right-handed parallel beta-helix repeat-containing protein [Planctomycetota bacterium]
MTITSRIHKLLSIEELERRVAPATLFVDWNAAGSDNGAAWADAYTDLQSALASAASGDEIWVAAGTYKPTTSADRTATFRLASGVSLYGGFDGAETARSQRDWITNITTLSGDLNGDDAGFTNNGENSYHVVTAKGVTAVFDGFTVSGGNANGGFAADYGGGMYNSYSAVLTIANCTFRWNSAKVGGGGIYNHLISARSLVTDCLFTENTSNGSGGGMCNKSSDLTVVNSVFSRNTGINGAGLYNSTSSPTANNCVFNQNAASYAGGGVYNSLSSPALTNCTFSRNVGQMYGGGMANTNSSRPTLANSILWGDTAGAQGNEIWNFTGSLPAIGFSDIQGCGGSGAAWNASLGIDNGGNINSDPLFVNASDPAGADGVFGTADDGLALDVIRVSPGIDAAAAAGAPSFDAVGRARPMGDGVDMGAYESAATVFKLGPGGSVRFRDSDGDEVAATYDGDSGSLLAISAIPAGLGLDIVGIRYLGATEASRVEILVADAQGNGATTAGRVYAAGQVFGTFIVQGWIEGWMGGELAAGETISTLPGGSMGDVGDMSFENDLAGNLLIGNNILGEVSAEGGITGLVAAGGVATGGSVSSAGDFNSMILRGDMAGLISIGGDLVGSIGGSGSFTGAIHIGNDVAPTGRIAAAGAGQTIRPGALTVGGTIWGIVETNILDGVEFAWQEGTSPYRDNRVTLTGSDGVITIDGSLGLSPTSGDEALVNLYVNRKAASLASRNVDFNDITGACIRGKIEIVDGVVLGSINGRTSRRGALKINEAEVGRAHSNDSIPTAEQLADAPLTQVFGCIADASDQDYYTFHVTASNRRVVFVSQSTNFEPLLALYDASGNLLSTSAGNRRGAAVVGYRFDADGQYTIRVASADGVGNYKLILTTTTFNINESIVA